MEGWIRINRKITENSMWFSEPFTRSQAWIDLLLIATYHDCSLYIRGNKVTVSRGQIAYSREKLAKRWGWSRGKVERFIHELENEHCIVQQKKRLITLISVVNYDKYQNNDTTDSTTDNTTDGHLLRRDKNIKNIYKLSLIDKPKHVFDEKSKTRLPESPDFPFKKISDLWNTTCTRYPKIFTLSEGRKNKMRIRVDEMGGIDKAKDLLKAVFEKMQASSFLRGDGKHGWRASFDWLFSNDKNWVKVYEGNYDDKPAPEKNNAPKTETQDHTDDQPNQVLTPEEIENRQRKNAIGIFEDYKKRGEFRIAVKFCAQAYDFLSGMKLIRPDGKMTADAKNMAEKQIVRSEGEKYSGIKRTENIERFISESVENRINDKPGFAIMEKSCALKIYFDDLIRQKSDLCKILSADLKIQT
jgi:hypothetical protein